MATKSYTGIFWTFKELIGLVEDDNSCVHFERKRRHIALHPFHLSNLNKALHEILSELINFYDYELKGLVLDYKNPKLLSSLGGILHDSHFIHVDIEADFYVFRPEIGSPLSGIVNKRASNHVGILVHKAFNVTINQSDEEEKWQGHYLYVGQTVSFTVTHVDFKGRLPYIKGELLPGQVEIPEDGYEAPSTSPVRKKSIFYSEDEDSDVDDHKKIKTIKTPAKTHRSSLLSSLAEDTSDSDSSSDEEETKRSIKKSIKSEKFNAVIINKKLDTDSDSSSDDTPRSAKKAKVKATVINNSHQKRQYSSSDDCNDSRKETKPPPKLIKRQKAESSDSEESVDEKNQTKTGPVKKNKIFAHAMSDSTDRDEHDTVRFNKSIVKVEKSESKLTSPKKTTLLNGEVKSPVKTKKSKEIMCETSAEISEKKKGKKSILDKASGIVSSTPLKIMKTEKNPENMVANKSNKYGKNIEGDSSSSEEDSPVLKANKPVKPKSTSKKEKRLRQQSNNDEDDLSTNSIIAPAQVKIEKDLLTSKKSPTKSEGLKSMLQSDSDSSDNERTNNNRVQKSIKNATINVSLENVSNIEPEPSNEDPNSQELQNQSKSTKKSKKKLQNGVRDDQDLDESQSITTPAPLEKVKVEKDVVKSSKKTTKKSGPKSILQNDSDSSNDDSSKKKQIKKSILQNDSHDNAMVKNPAHAQFNKDSTDDDIRIPPSRTLKIEKVIEKKKRSSKKSPKKSTGLRSIFQDDSDSSDDNSRNNISPSILNLKVEKDGDERFSPNKSSNKSALAQICENDDDSSDNNRRTKKQLQKKIKKASKNMSSLLEESSSDSDDARDERISPALLRVTKVEKNPEPTSVPKGSPKKSVEVNKNIEHSYISLATDNIITQSIKKESDKVKKSIKTESDKVISAKAPEFVAPVAPTSPKKSKSLKKSQKTTEQTPDETDYDSSDSTASKKAKKKKKQEALFIDGIKIKQEPMSDVEGSNKSKRKKPEETSTLDKNDISIKIEQETIKIKSESKKATTKRKITEENQQDMNVKNEPASDVEGSGPVKKLKLIFSDD